MRERDDHRVIGNEVFHRNLADFCNNRALTRTGVLRFDRLELVFDDVKHAFFTSENVEKVGDFHEDTIVFPFDFITFKTGELIEAKFEDRVDLTFRENVVVALNCCL